MNNTPPAKSRRGELQERSTASRFLVMHLPNEIRVTDPLPKHPNAWTRKQPPLSDKCKVENIAAVIAAAPRAPAALKTRAGPLLPANAFEERQRRHKNTPRPAGGKPGGAQSKLFKLFPIHHLGYLFHVFIAPAGQADQDDLVAGKPGRDFQGMGQSVGRFQGRDDAFFT